MFFIFYMTPFGIGHLLDFGRIWNMDTHWTAVLGPALFANPFAQVTIWEASTGYGVFMNMAVAAINETLFGGTIGGAMTVL